MIKSGADQQRKGKMTDSSRGSTDDLINRCSQCEEAAVKVTVGAKAHWAKRHHIPPHLRLSQQDEAGCSHHLYTLTPAALLSFPQTEPFPTLITTPLPSKGAFTVISNQNIQKSLTRQEATIKDQTKPKWISIYKRLGEKYAFLAPPQI